MSSPFVSCIMPTANRPQFAELAMLHFLNQDYVNSELLIIDDGKYSIHNIVPKHSRIKYLYHQSFGSVGNKRNYGCNNADGEIIVHLDDDDYYASDWITRQVNVLIDSNADICGLNEIYFFSPIEQKYWRYENKSAEIPWLSGATLAYYKRFWIDHPFKDVSIGEDYDFIWNNGANIRAHDYVNGFCAILHAGNSTIKPFENPRHKKNAVEDMDVEYEGKKPPNIIM